MAPPSVSSKGVYSFIHEVDPAPIPAALHELLAEIGLVRLGPGMVIPPPPPPPTSVAGWDKDEYADREDPPPPAGESEEAENGYRGSRRTPPAPPASELIEDKTNQMLIMFPIDKTRGLNRDKQQGRMLAHLIRTQRRQGKDFIRQIGYRWLAAQKDHFDAQPDQAYRHLDQNIDMPGPPPTRTRACGWPVRMSRIMCTG